MKKSMFLLFIMMFVSAGSLFAGEVNKGRISGKLLIDNKETMAGGMVRFFNKKSAPPPEPGKYWKVADEVADIEKDGNFSIELHEGSYYMWATKRISGEDIGPPREGDHLLISKDEEGRQKLIDVIEGEHTDLGTITGAVPFKLKIAKKITAIKGRTVDADGKPLKGALVFAFTSPAMTKPPLFMSDITNDAGEYTLRVHEGGKYYLRVRDVYGGGPPHGGPLISGYSATAINVKTHEIKKGVDITVIRHPERGPEGRQIGNISEIDVKQKKQQEMEEK